MVAEPLRQRPYGIDRETDGCREVVVSAKEPIPRIRAGVAEIQLVPLVSNVLPEALLEHGVVVVADHELRKPLPQQVELGQSRADLMPTQRVQGRQRRRMEGRDDDVVAGVDVVQTNPQHPFLGGLENPIVQRLLQRDRSHIDGAIRVLAVVDGKTQAIALGRVGEHEPTDVIGDVGRVGFLQTEQISTVALDELSQLGCRTVLAQVVRDDLHATPHDRGARMPTACAPLDISPAFAISSP